MSIMSIAAKFKHQLFYFPICHIKLFGTCHSHLTSHKTQTAEQIGSQQLFRSVTEKLISKGSPFVGGRGCCDPHGETLEN